MSKIGRKICKKLHHVSFFFFIFTVFLYFVNLREKNSRLNQDSNSGLQLYAAAHSDLKRPKSWPKVEKD